MKEMGKEERNGKKGRNRGKKEKETIEIRNELSNGNSYDPRTRRMREKK